MEIREVETHIYIQHTEQPAPYPAVAQTERMSMKLTSSKPFQFVAIAALMTLAACAGPATKPTSESAAAPAAQAEQVVLPRVALTGPVLQDILLGEIAGREGNFKVSVAALSRAAKATGDPRLAERATLAGIYARLYKEALGAARLWAKLQPESENAHEALATMLLELGKLDEAQSELETILDRGARRKALGQAYLRVAGTLSQLSRGANATTVMERLTALHPQNPDAQLALAHLAVRSGELSVASAAIDRALLLRPNWEDAAILKGRLLVRQSDNANTDKFFRNFLRHNPHAWRVRMNYARHLVDSRDWEGARKQFELVLQDRKGDGNVMFALGLLSLQTERLQDARRYLKQVVEMDPDNDQALLYLGEVDEKLKDYPQALQWYGQVSSGSYAFEASVRYALVTAKQGRLEEALGLIHGIIPDTNDQRAELALAEENMLRDAKRYGDALTVLNAALKRLPEQKDLLYARAIVAEKMDNLRLHEHDLRLLLKLDPNDANAMNALGYTLADRTNRQKEAYALIKRALELRPNDPFILDSMGWVHYRMGNLTDALKYLREAIKLRPDAEISAHLGEVLWVSGKHAAARRVWDRALKSSPKNEMLLRVIKKFNP